MTMTKTNTALILRFRDLVTPPGGTVGEHQKLVDWQGSVWWGWWKRQTEKSPMDLFESFHRRLQHHPDGVVAFVFDSGQEKLYQTQLLKIAVAPEGGTISTPDPTRTPVYYQLAAYPAWFLFSSFREKKLGSLALYFNSFPTHYSVDATTRDKVNKRIRDPHTLRAVDATMYEVRI